MSKKTIRRTVLGVVSIGFVVCGTFAWLHWDSVLVWYRFRRDFEFTGSNRQGYAEYRHRPTGLIFVRTPRHAGRWVERTDLAVPLGQPGPRRPGVPQSGLRVPSRVSAQFTIGALSRLEQELRWWSWSGSPERAHRAAQGVGTA